MQIRRSPQTQKDSRSYLLALYGVIEKQELVGSNKCASQGGVNVEEQNRALDNFRCGRHKVLVATSVADEGLDIASCNLIIKYNSSGNELTKIQRRGRGRAKDSRSYLLALYGVIEKQELESARAESLMYRTLEDLHNLPDGEISRMVKLKTMELLAKEEHDEELE
uniref:Helicase C-terminal domain-containing protein n=1 Tax=Steinernema glaseri TaxID=37863 RepID=A0A1I7YDV2_9BILA